MDAEKVYQHVSDHYGSLARGDNPAYSGAIAKAFGYSEEELNSIPKESNLGVSCGNPLAIAGLREGETVIDLGSGAGFDIFLAAKKVASNGCAIGVDMNKDMLAKARNNQAKSPQASTISFIEGNITAIPLPDETANCIISNCVINLVPEPEKPAVFVEMARLLKPGGRVAIFDILTRKPLTSALKESVALYVGCVAGASQVEDYQRYLKDSGFSDIMIIDAESDLNVYVDMETNIKPTNEGAKGCCAKAADTTSFAADGANQESCYSSIEGRKTCCGEAEDTKPSGCCSPSNKATKDITNLVDIDINEWAGSFKIFAVKN